MISTVPNWRGGSYQEKICLPPPNQEKGKKAEMERTKLLRHRKKKKAKRKKF